MSSQLLLISQSMDGSQVGNSYIWQIWKKKIPHKKKYKISFIFYVTGKYCNFAFQGTCQVTAVKFQKYQWVNIVGVEVRLVAVI